MNQLPKVKLQRSPKIYYYDGRLTEIRNTKNPHDSISLTRDEDASIDYFVSQSKPNQIVKLPFKLSDLEYVAQRAEA